MNAKEIIQVAVAIAAIFIGIDLGQRLYRRLQVKKTA